MSTWMKNGLWNVLGIWLFLIVVFGGALGILYVTITFGFPGVLAVFGASVTIIAFAFGATHK